MTTGGERIVVVGASLAGVRAAEAIRRQGYAGEITMIGEEAHFPPYDRPPLSKEMLLAPAGPGHGRIRVDPRLGAKLRLGQRAAGLSPQDHQVSLADGSHVGYRGLVVATGARARRLACCPPGLPGVHQLRTFDDSACLQRRLASPGRAVVAGAGFIGMEVAAAARQMGWEVTVVDVLRAPMQRALGEQMGGLVAALHRQHGVQQLYGRGICAIEGSARVEQVVLDDGQVLAADLVVAAVGAQPCTEWLEGAALKVSNGLACASTLFVEGQADIVAAGDVASWWHPRLGAYLRVEHWATAAAQAQVAGRNLARRLAGQDAEEQYAEVPYFWTDQYDWKLQLVGMPAATVEITEGSVAAARFAAVYREDDHVTGALCVNWPGRLARYRALVSGAAA